jgi:hypothetical protein
LSEAEFQNSENTDNIVLTNYEQFSSKEINNDNVDCIRLLNEGDPSIGLVALKFYYFYIINENQ